MAKINIKFNNTEYQINEFVLADATNGLRQHLSTVMNGSGAVINFGGVAYNIDSSKLTIATNDFVSHLGTIAGDGLKVAVNGVEYSIDSNKMSDVVSDLHIALDNLSKQVVAVDFATASWDEIAEVAQAGMAGECFKVGDTKDLTLNYADGTSETVTVKIGSFGKCVTEDGGKDNMAIVLTQPLQQLIPFATSYKQLPGKYADISLGALSDETYNATNFAIFLRETVFPALPQELQSAIKTRAFAPVSWDSTTVYGKLWGIDVYNPNTYTSASGTMRLTKMTPRNATTPVTWYHGTLYNYRGNYFPQGTDANGKWCTDLSGSYPYMQESVYTANNGVVFGFCL